MPLLTLAILATQIITPAKPIQSTKTEQSKVESAPIIPNNLMLEFYGLQLKGVKQREDLLKTNEYIQLQKTTEKINANIVEMQKACGKFSVSLDQDNKPVCVPTPKQKK